MGVIIWIFDGVQGISFGDDVVDFVFEDFEVGVFVETNVVNDLFWLENGNRVFEHVILLEEDIRTGQGCWHFLFNFVELLDSLLWNGQLIFGPCQLQGEFVLLLHQKLVIFQVLFFTDILSLVLDISKHFQLSFEFDHNRLHFMLAHHSSVVFVSFIPQDVLVFVHQVIVKFPVLVDLQANDVVLLFVSLTHFCFLGQVLLNLVDCGFELGDLIFETGDFGLVGLFTVFVGSEEFWDAFLIFEKGEFFEFGVLLSKNFIEVSDLTLKSIVLLA